ncbi:MAG: FtsH protease activity modulator HflK [Rhodospirillaceae bacterium]|nr:FtsH protease activity modulator HflK [Rhodospirillaceae bacterium]
MLRRGQDGVRRVMPGGVGTPKGIALIALLVVAIWMATGFYRVDPKEAGVELVFGEVVHVSAQGLHWNWPSPIGETEKPKITEISKTNVGFIQLGESRRTEEQESLMLTGDENIVDIKVVVHWRIDARPVTRTVDGAEITSQPGIRNYLFNIRNPEKTLKDATESAIREIVGKTPFEEIRTEGRLKIEGDAKLLIQGILNEYGAGIEVVRVQLLGADPPDKVLDAFRDVQAARADRDTMINEATAYQKRILERANGRADQITRAAEAFKQERIQIAQGETSRFLALLREYEASKDITRKRIYISTMQNILKSMEKIIVDQNGDQGVVPYLPLDELMKQRGTPRNEDGEATPGTGATVGRPEADASRSQ